jgi:hypothetical protein
MILIPTLAWQSCRIWAYSYGRENQTAMVLSNGWCCRNSFNWRGSCRRECIATTNWCIWWGMTKTQMRLFWPHMLETSCSNLIRGGLEDFRKAKSIRKCYLAPGTICTRVLDQLDSDTRIIKQWFLTQKGPPRFGGTDGGRRPGPSQRLGPRVQGPTAIQLSWNQQIPKCSFLYRWRNRWRPTSWTKPRDLE